MRGVRIGVLQATIRPKRKGISGVKLSPPLTATSAVFDDPNLVSPAGLVPVLALADRAGLRDLADEHLKRGERQGCEPGVEGRLAGRGDGRRG